MSKKNTPPGAKKNSIVILTSLSSGTSWLNVQVWQYQASISLLGLRLDNDYRTRVRSLAMLVSDSLTHSRLVNLIDVTLACEDNYSKLVEVFTFADVDDEDRVGNSLLQS